MVPQRISTPVASVLLLIFLVTLFLSMSFIALYAHQIRRLVSHHRKDRLGKELMSRRKRQRAKEWAENVAKAAGMGVGAIGTSSWVTDEEHQKGSSSPELSRRSSRELHYASQPGHATSHAFPLAQNTASMGTHPHAGHKKGISIHLPFLSNHHSRPTSPTHPRAETKSVSGPRSRRSSQSTTTTRGITANSCEAVPPELTHRPSYSKKISASELRALLEVEQHRTGEETGSIQPNSRLVRVM